MSFHCFPCCFLKRSASERWTLSKRRLLFLSRLPRFIYFCEYKKKIQWTIVSCEISRIGTATYVTDYKYSEEHLISWAFLWLVSSSISWQSQSFISIPVSPNRIAWLLTTTAATAINVIIKAIFPFLCLDQNRDKIIANRNSYRTMLIITAVIQLWDQSF